MGAIPIPRLPNNDININPSYTKTTTTTPSPPRLLPRQFSAISIPASYGNIDGPAPQTVVGIVLGSVLGFIFVLYLVSLAMGAGPMWSDTVTVEEDVEVRRVPRRRGGGEEIIEVWEERESVRKRPARERSRSRSRHREQIIVEESAVSRDDHEDVVEVFEEHSSVDLPPRTSRPGSRSYRPADPYDYGSSLVSD